MPAVSTTYLPRFARVSHLHLLRFFDPCARLETNTSSTRCFCGNWKIEELFWVDSASLQQQRSLLRFLSWRFCSGFSRVSDTSLQILHQNHQNFLMLESDFVRNTSHRASPCGPLPGLKSTWRCSGVKPSDFPVRNACRDCKIMWHGNCQQAPRWIGWWLSRWLSKTYFFLGKAVPTSLRCAL